MELLNTILEPLLGAIFGGGLVGLLTLSQKKESAKLDNTERLTAKYMELAEKYEQDANEREVENKQLREEIAKLNEQIVSQNKLIGELNAKIEQLQNALVKVPRKEKKANKKA